MRDKVRWVAAAALAVTVASGCSKPAPRPPVALPSASPAVPAPSPTADAPDWVGTWAVGAQGGGRAFARQTLRQVVHTSIGGDSARLRLSNEFGTRPLTVSNVRLDETAVTFGGATSITVPPGKTVASDDTALAVPAGGDVTVGFYLPAATGPSTQHALAGRTNHFAAGDQTTAPALSGARPTKSYYFLAGLDVRNADATGAVVTFGASITDGLGAAFGKDQRWPDQLADRLRASGRTVGVLNQGISANRMIAGGYGKPALRRFARDALQQPGVRWVIISDNALNDLGAAGPPSAGELTAALRELTTQSHAAGVKVICSTLTPFRGAGYWTPRAERGRATVNTFVRSADSGCDAVLDQDTATHDPGSPSRFRPTFDSGDHLHPNPAGMTAIARAANLDWFG